MRYYFSLSVRNKKMSEMKMLLLVGSSLKWLLTLGLCAGGFRSRSAPGRQLNKVTKAGHLYNRSSVLSQPGGALDLKTALEFTRQPLAQNPMLAAGYFDTQII